MTITEPSARRSSPLGHAACDGDLLGVERSGPSYELRAASVRGPAHRIFEEPRQDATGALATAHRVAFGVADGIGSQAHSASGSRTALRAALEVLLSTEEDAVGMALDAAVEAAVEAVLAEADAIGEDPEALCTTLTVGVAAPTPDGNLRCAYAQVGDSPLYLFDPGASTWTELLPEVDEHLPTNWVTSYLPHRPEGVRSAGLVLAPGQALLACTDGLSIPLGGGDGPFGVALAERWATPRPLLHLIADLGYPTYHDDRSAAVLWNTADPNGPNDLHDMDNLHDLDAPEEVLDDEA